ncbi:hypothetical protein EGW08_003614, partial [Elysia chlorotica]
PGDDFRGHPVRRAHHCVALALLSAELRAEAKVCEFHRANHAQQNVVALDVPVDDVSVVQELQGFEALATDGCDLALLHDGLRDNVVQMPDLNNTYFHDDPELVVVDVVAVEEVDDVLVAVELHDLDLGDDELLLGLVVQVHHLDG